jgi:hypothetical protein
MKSMLESVRESALALGVESALMPVMESVLESNCKSK